MKIKENTGSFNSNSKKFNLSKINNKDTFKFNKNYLRKIVTDTNFLKFSVLKRYFNFSSFPDPFFLALTKFGNETKADSEADKNILPINEELLQSIKTR